MDHININTLVNMNTTINMFSNGLIHIHLCVYVVLPDILGSWSAQLVDFPTRIADRVALIDYVYSIQTSLASMLFGWYLNLNFIANMTGKNLRLGDYYVQLPTITRAYVYWLGVACRNILCTSGNLRYFISKYIRTLNI